MQVSVSVEQSIAQQLLAQGIPLPEPERGFALVDTGATSSCIDEAAAARLSLPAIDVVTIASASHASTQQNVHPIQIEVVGLPITISAPVLQRSRGQLLAVGVSRLAIAAEQHTGLLSGRDAAPDDGSRVTVFRTDTSGWTIQAEALNGDYMLGGPTPVGRSPDKIRSATTSPAALPQGAHPDYTEAMVPFRELWG